MLGYTLYMTGTRACIASIHAVRVCTRACLCAHACTCTCACLHVSGLMPVFVVSAKVPAGSAGTLPLGEQLVQLRITADTLHSLTRTVRCVLGRDISTIVVESAAGHCILTPGVFHVLPSGESNVVVQLGGILPVQHVRRLVEQDAYTCTLLDEVARCRAAGSVSDDWQTQYPVLFNWVETLHSRSPAAAGDSTVSSNLNYALLLPEIILAGAAVLVLFADTFRAELHLDRRLIPWLTALGALISGLVALAYLDTSDNFAGLLTIDDFTTFFRVLFTAIVVVLIPRPMMLRVSVMSRSPVAAASSSAPASERV